MGRAHNRKDSIMTKEDCPSSVFHVFGATWPKEGRVWCVWRGKRVLRLSGATENSGDAFAIVCYGSLKSNGLQ